MAHGRFIVMWRTYRVHLIRLKISLSNRDLMTIFFTVIVDWLPKIISPKYLSIWSKEKIFSKMLLIFWHTHFVMQNITDWRLHVLEYQRRGC